VIISNGVLNLTPDKATTLQAMARAEATGSFANWRHLGADRGAARSKIWSYPLNRKLLSSEGLTVTLCACIVSPTKSSLIQSGGGIRPDEAAATLLVTRHWSLVTNDQRLATNKGAKSDRVLLEDERVAPFGHASSCTEEAFCYL
jgi:hypothetical protein